MKNILIVMALLFATQAHAGPPSVLGGKTMSAGTAHHVGVGWPSLTYEWWHAGNPDWALGAELIWGDWSGEYSNVEIGGAFNVPMRWNISRRGRASFAFRFAPGVLLGGTDFGPGSDRFTFGARGELGVPITVNVHPRLNIITGVTVPLTFYCVVSFDPYVIVPIMGRLGIEGTANSWVVPSLVFEFGPGMAFGDFGTEVDFAFRVWLGTTFW